MTVDEHGVAAVRGTVDHVQERDRRRLLEEGGVGVPEIGLHLVHRVEADDLRDVGVNRVEIRHRVDRAEEGGDVTQATKRRVEARQRQHQVVTQRLGELGSDAFIDGVEVESVNFGTHSGHRPDVQFAHEALLRVVSGA